MYIELSMIFIPIISSIILFSFENRYIHYTAVLTQGIILTLTAFVYRQFILFGDKKLVLGGFSQISGIELRLDGMAVSFLMISVLIWTAVILYSLDKIKEDTTFGFFLLFLQGAFIGFLLANDLFTIFIFIDLITILSTLLIVYERDDFSLRAGFNYLLVNSLGTLLYLIGLALIYNLTGSFNISIVSQIMPDLSHNEYAQLAYIFIVAALGVKSAFFPVYNWLPKAHGAAPSAVSALLSGLLVKTGVYIFIRMLDIFEPVILMDFMVYIGFITFFSGALFAVAQKDIKQLLAFSSISHIGLILIGLSSAYYGKIGAVYHIISHAFFKSALFFCAGYIIEYKKERRVTEIRGIFSDNFYVAVTMLICLLALSGMPFFGGYPGKSLIKDSLKHSDELYYLLNGVNIISLVYFLKLLQIFIPERPESSLTDIDTKKNIKKKINFRNIRKYRPKMKIPTSGKISLVLLIILSMYFGINSAFVQNIFYIEQTVNIIKTSWTSAAEYSISLIAAWIIYVNFVKKEHRFLYFIRHYNMSFESSVFMIVGFLFSMMVYNFVFNLY